jgi:high-affinity Fe2+/Pb2+ permease
MSDREPVQSQGDQARSASDDQNGGEDEKQRLSRKLIEVLNELRVALPGVQVLFAFLLTLPFSNGFSRVTDFQRDVYAGTLLCAGIASMLLIAPSAYHRYRWRPLEHESIQGKKEMLIAQGRLSMAGLVFLGTSMTGALFLIFDVLFGTGPATAIAVAIGLGFAWFWYLLPIMRRGRDPKTPA